MESKIADCETFEEYINELKKTITDNGISFSEVQTELKTSKSSITALEKKIVMKTKEVLITVIYCGYLIW